MRIAQTLSGALFAVMLAGSASAQVATLCLNCESEPSALARWGQQLRDNTVGLRQGLQTVQNGVQQVQQLQATYHAVTGITDFGSAVGALGYIGIQNPLPISPWAAQGLISGQGGATGMLSNLSGLYTGTHATSQVYRVPGESWIGREVNNNSAGLAGAQAASMQLYQSAAQRVPLLNQLQARINTAETQKEREALIARLSAEQAYIQNANVQASTLANMAQAQAGMREQRREERIHQSIDEFLAEGRSRGLMP